jgi:hypothetical protein
VSEQVNSDLLNLAPFFKRLADINAELIFGENGVNAEEPFAENI